MSGWLQWLQIGSSGMEGDDGGGGCASGAAVEDWASGPDVEDGTGGGKEEVILGAGVEDARLDEDLEGIFGAGKRSNEAIKGSSGRRLSVRNVVLW